LSLQNLIVALGDHLKKPMKSTLLFFILAINFSQIAAQKDYAENVTIVRDEYGIPHIFGKTDADAAYGLAWAHSEDDFVSIQKNLLPAKGLAGRITGKEGLLFDFFLKFIDLDRRVAEQYQKNVLSADYMAVLKGYVKGLNDFAAKHKDELLHKKLFPITEEEIIKSYTLKLSLMAGMGLALKAVKENRIDMFFSVNDTKGSNAIAISKEKMQDDKTLLVVNSHQPIEGGFAWYEAHVQSEEGWNILGGLFPGGTTIFVGSNEHLGWAHTVNFHTFGDIYKMKTKGSRKYFYNGKWENFEIRKEKFKVKLGAFTIGFKKRLFDSEFGPVMKTKHGMYSFRFPVYNDIRAGEQWYRMNKSNNFQEFEKAMKMEAIPLFNTVYADKDDHIMLHSGGQIPDRDPSLDWTQPLDGTNPKYKWEKLVTYDRKPTVIDPDCGYVYNANNTPLLCTGQSCNWNDYFVGLQMFHFNRGELFEQYFENFKGKLSDADVDKIKYDKTFSKTGSYMKHFSMLYNLNENKYPKLKNAILTMKRWDFEADVADTNASLVLVTHKMLQKKLSATLGLLMIRKENISESEAVWAITQAQKFLKDKHGSLNPPLGQVQRHIRGTVNLPAAGMSEQLRATESSLHDEKKGIYRINGGDGYIQYAKFSKDGVEIQSINAYGASARPESPHYTSQMELFLNQKMRKMTLKKEEVFKNAVKIYAPK
jgi:acyl-homoserine-lactone acylase